MLYTVICKGRKETGQGQGEGEDLKGKYVLRRSAVVRVKKRIFKVHFYVGSRKNPGYVLYCRYLYMLLECL